jgi:hypothetical protein
VRVRTSKAGGVVNLLSVIDFKVTATPLKSKQQLYIPAFIKKHQITLPDQKQELKPSGSCSAYTTMFEWHKNISRSNINK